MSRKKWKNPTRGKNNSYLPEYYLWNKMNYRCNPNGAEQRKNPTYVGCECSDAFKNYDLWLEWARQQKGFLQRDENGAIFQQDKDLLVKGNKLYSEDTCVFIPKELNGFLNTSKAVRGQWPIGVYKYKNAFISQVSNKDGKGYLQTYLGSYQTPEEAFCAYKRFKEDKAKAFAIKYSGLVDERAIEALLLYEVDIND